MFRSGAARRRSRATGSTVRGMKTILRAILGAAVAASVFSVLLRRVVAQQAEAYRRLGAADHVPTVHPIADAEPDVEEPLEESDLRVAQNTPH